MSLPSSIDRTTKYVRGALDGDADAIQWLVEHFSPVLYALAARQLGARLGAEYDPADVVQDVWVSSLPRLSMLELKGPRVTPVVLKYLSTAVTNRVRNVLQKHLTRRFSGDDLPLDELPDDSSGIVTRIVRAEKIRSVHIVIRKLSEDDQNLVIMRGVEQRPLSDVAESLGIERGAAAVRYHRALKRLQAHFPRSIFMELVDECR